MVDRAGTSALECLYCGATAESTPPYAVAYCHCRSGDAALPPRERAAA